MIRRRLELSALLTAITLLGACGAGGGASGAQVASIPPPPVPPPPPPPPSPPPPAQTAVVNVGWYLFGDALGGFQEYLGGPDRNSLTVDYDAASGTYTLGGLSALGSADSKAGPEPANFSYFQKIQPGNTFPERVSLTVLKDSPANSRIVLSYLSYGLWSKDVSRAVASDGTVTYGTDTAGAFLLGTETLPNNMPRTGSATYQGIVDSPDQLLLGSTGSLTADFATGSVATSLSLHSAFALNGAPVTVTWLLSGAGAIGAGTSHFDGNLTGTLNVTGVPSNFPVPMNNVSATGSFLGGFYGPNAEEAGYAFSVNSGDPVYVNLNAVTGVFVGKKP